MIFKKKNFRPAHSYDDLLKDYEKEREAVKDLVVGDYETLYSRYIDSVTVSNG